MRASALCSRVLSSFCEGINPTMGAPTKNGSAGNLDPGLASLQNWEREVSVVSAIQSRDFYRLCRLIQKWSIIPDFASSA